MFGSEVRQPAWGPVNGIPRAPVWLSTGLLVGSGVNYLQQIAIQIATRLSAKSVECIELVRWECVEAFCSGVDRVVLLWTDDCCSIDWIMTTMMMNKRRRVTQTMYLYIISEKY